MAISGFTGLPGSGKSYGVVANVILPALRMGRHVVTNIPLVLEELYKQFPLARITQFQSQDVVSPEWWIENVPPGAVAVIDECWKFWPAGKRQNDYKPVELSFFAEHRHRVDDATKKTTEIVLVTQDLSQISNCVRALVDSTSICVKMGHLGANRKYRVDIYSGAVTGAKGPKGRRINTMIGSYKKEIYCFYRSATQSESVGDELKVDDRGTIWKHPVVRYVLPVCLVGIVVVGIWSYHNFQSMLGPGKKSAVDAGKPPVSPLPSSSPSSPHPVPSGVVNVSLPFGPVDSQKWRLAGVVKTGDVVTVWIANNRGTRMLDPSHCDLSPRRDPTCTLNGELIASWTGPAVVEPAYAQPVYAAAAAAMPTAPMVAGSSPSEPHIVQGIPRADSPRERASGENGERDTVTR